MNQNIGLASLLFTFAPGIFAAVLSPIPSKPGFSGVVGGGAAYFHVESNFIGGNRFVDLDNEQVSSLTSSPSSEASFSPDIQLDIRYTFSDGKTQIFAGNALADLVRLDLSQQLGIKHKVDGLGTLSASYLFSTIPTEVWEDPFLVGEKRKRSNRDSSGFKVAWDDIFQAPIGVAYTYRNVDIDQERSGEALVNLGRLNSTQQNKLDREGAIHRLEVLSLLDIAPNQKVSPEFTYTRFDSDGAAASSDSYQFQLSYLYVDNDYSWVVTSFVSQRDYDEANPIFDKKPDTFGFGLSSSVFIRNLFPDPNVDLLFGVAWVNGDSDVNFYDSEIIAGNASVLYRF
ncbi:DUF2860 family protein [Vibrio sp. WXL103]|uniref:DUF2860 family protein n=1 Tax=Vibrio sp. WXL103 TaxID=3450710 RepID=UPI003EC6FC76